MGGIPVVEVTRGGIPVTESDRGVPYEIAANGRGIPVRFVSSGGVPFQGVGFSLGAFMASQSDGLYYDMTKLDRFFQESTGPTLADDVGEGIGLALDQRTWGGKTLAQVIGEQAELVTNGTFPTDLAGWTSANTGTGTSVWESPGRLREASTDASNIGQRVQVLTTIVGKTYCLSVGATIFSGSARILIGTSSAGSEIANADVASSTTVYYFVATTTTTYLTLRAGNGSAAGNVAYDNVTCKLVPGNHGRQATGSLKPLRQTAGAKFDGSDDNWLTPYLPGSGANFIVALVTVPTILSSNHYFIGSLVDVSNRLFAGVNASGVFRVGVGSSFAEAGPDLRGLEAVVGLSADGANYMQFVNQTAFSPVAYTGTTAGGALRVGALNSGGAAGAFFGGAVKKLVCGREALTHARYLQIRNALLAT